MDVVLHGEIGAAYGMGLDALMPPGVALHRLPEQPLSKVEVDLWQRAEIIVSNRLDASLPSPSGLRLWQVPAAGYEHVDFGLLPAGVAVCNCFGHEHGIAEFVMAALLARIVPLDAADRGLRAGAWLFRGDGARGELSGRSIGLLGYGHIGREIARRARAFDMSILVANRSRPAADEAISGYWGLDALEGFWGAAEFIVASLPLLPETRSIVGAAAFARMRPDAVVVNVGRGPLVDEAALYAALSERRIAGAVIDTWYRYGGPAKMGGRPADLPFERLDNIVMSPHMSGWTTGTLRRRQTTLAENAQRLMAGAPLLNPVRRGA